MKFLCFESKAKPVVLRPWLREPPFERRKTTEPRPPCKAASRSEPCFATSLTRRGLDSTDVHYFHRLPAELRTTGSPGLGSDHGQPGRAAIGAPCAESP